MYRKGIMDLASMSDLPLEFRQVLAPRMTTPWPSLEQVTPSLDGSAKLVLGLADGALVNAVLMPDGDRLTLCLSTQVGCGFGCAFCLTGTMGVERTPRARSWDSPWPTRTPRRGRVTHMVFMGMGALANLAAVVKAIESSPTRGSASALAPSRCPPWGSWRDREARRGGWA
jgi:23S rRNA (adenine2503-C2)-methyltransferase